MRQRIHKSNGFKIIFVITSLYCLAACAVVVENAAEEKGLQNVSYASVLEQNVIEPDYVIKYGTNNDTSSEFVEVYSAKNKSVGTIINIHGGCWLESFDIAHSRVFASALSENGYKVYNVEYRRTGNGGEWPVAIKDIDVALKSIKADLEGTTTNTFLMGHSAGGHLAMLAGIQAQWTGLQIIGLAPIVDVVAYAKGENSCQSATKQFMQGMPEENLTDYEDATLTNKAFDNKKTPLILIGTEDQIVQAQYSQHDDAEIISIEGAGHFDFIHPKSTAFQTLLKILEQ